MRAHQIMTRQVITVGPDTTIVEAAATMLRNHISGLPGDRRKRESWSASSRKAISSAAPRSAPSEGAVDGWKACCSAPVPRQPTSCMNGAARSVK